jgi:hypothetical protein
MTDEEYEQKENELKDQIRTQVWVVYEALMAWQHESQKLSDLQHKLRWLHVEETTPNKENDHG